MCAVSPREAQTAPPWNASLLTCPSRLGAAYPQYLIFSSPCTPAGPGILDWQSRKWNPATVVPGGNPRLKWEFGLQIVRLQRPLSSHPLVSLLGLTSEMNPSTPLSLESPGLHFVLTFITGSHSSFSQKKSEGMLLTSPCSRVLNKICIWDAMTGPT